MSLARGGGRGRGSRPPLQRGGFRGASTPRGTSSRGNATRGNSVTRAGFGQPPRGYAVRGSRGAPNGPKSNGVQQQQRQAGAIGGARATGGWGERYQALTKSREKERAEAIRQGLIADPDKPRSLAEAITPVGTCQDMCAEYERVERVVQNDVWPEETDPNHSAYSNTSAPPDESRMVKKFRRAAAGLEEQLPSDLRPPLVLKRTCDYLFDEVIGNATVLEKVHHFVWDRTRAVRNDFSIQQLTRPEDLRLAIECYERIARFHILSLHQLAVQPRPYDQYDSQQEREQLDRTLLSLMQYYEDSRGRVDLRNEAEFRAYCVIFQLQDPTPDLEDRVQSWPRHIVDNGRVQQALDLYAAACNTMDAQGPLKPRASHVIAQQDWQRFWNLVTSKQVSYLMACVAEIYFNLVRRTALNALFRGFKQKENRSAEDWTPELLLDVFAFDDEDQVYTFCEAYGFSFRDRQDGQQYLDLASVKDRSLPAPDVGLPKQIKSGLVEEKRCGRTLSAVIDGMTVRQAIDAGMAVEDVREEDMEDATEGEEQGTTGFTQPFLEDTSDPNNGDSLFIPEEEKVGHGESEVAHSSPFGSGFGGLTNGQTKTTGTNTNGFSFGKPSTAVDVKPGPSAFSPFAPKPDDGGNSAVPAKQKSLFDFKAPASATQTDATQPSTTEPPAPVVDVPKFQPSTFSFGAKSNTTSKPFSSGFGDQSSVLSKPLKAESTEESPSKGFSRQSPLGTPDAHHDDKENKPSPAQLQNYESPSVQSAPTSPDKAVTFGQPAAATTSSLNQPPAKAPQTSSNITSSSTPHSSVTSPSAITRRTSDNKPKKPSPLANSFSFEDVNDTGALQLGKQQVNAKPNLTSIIDRVAKDLINDDVAGFLSQYIEFTVQEVITEAQETVRLERMTAEADRFRHDFLVQKFAKRWRDRFWQTKLAKRGNRRRERARRGLEESRRSEGSDGLSVMSSSRRGSVPRSVGDAEAHRKMVDSLFQQTVRGGETSNPSQSGEHARPGSKRPLSSHGAASSMSGPAAHKRQKSTSHVDDRGRITKAVQSTDQHADLLKRSSFLGFTLPSDAQNRSTTRSNYFRMKALGLQPKTEPRGTKRPREESVDGTEQTSPPYLRSVSPSRPATDQPKSNALMPPPSTTHKQDDDEALFARLKAARESLAETATLLKADIEKEQELRRSFGSSASSNESPSMARARAEARLRASRAAPTFGKSSSDLDVPAYRLRESKFVPRDHYDKAIEKARELRESRSRETSRPQSRVDQHTNTSFTPPDEGPSAATKAAPATSRIKEPSPPTGISNGFDSPSLPLSQPASAIPDSNPFSNVDQQGSWGLANAQGQPWQPLNSFSQPIATQTFSNLNSQPTFTGPNEYVQDSEPHDFTVQPSQIATSLSKSFGSQTNFNNTIDERQQASPTPQPDSYLHTQTASQAISLLSDDEDDATPTYADHFAQQPAAYNASNPGDETAELFESGAEGVVEDSYAYGNPFAVLANDVEGGDTEEDTAEDHVSNDFESQVDEEFDEDVDGQNGYTYDSQEGDDDEELVDGEVEDGEEYDGDDDEDLEDVDEDGNGAVSSHQRFANGDYEEDDEEEEAVNPRAHIWNQPPPKNEALQVVGGTVEEAIELSD